MPTTIRDALLDDAGALAELHANAWLTAYRGLMSDEALDAISVKAWTTRWAERLRRDELTPVRVAVRGTRVVGFCVTATPSRDDDTEDDVAEIVALNVAPDAWRSGVGTALMVDALDRLRREGWRGVSLWILTGNARAESFYRRLGFEYDGAKATDDDDGAHELRMRLLLRSSAWLN
jgi:GNAT superfamily N-acetyltransferase